MVERAIFRLEWTRNAANASAKGFRTRASKLMKNEESRIPAKAHSVGAKNGFSTQKKRRR
jgi:hypothetical protein